MVADHFCEVGNTEKIVKINDGEDFGKSKKKYMQKQDLTAS